MLRKGGAEQLRTLCRGEPVNKRLRKGTTCRERREKILAKRKGDARRYIYTQLDREEREREKVS